MEKECLLTYIILANVFYNSYRQLLTKAVVFQVVMELANNNIGTFPDTACFITDVVHLL